MLISLRCICSNINDILLSWSQFALEYPRNYIWLFACVLMGRPGCCCVNDSLTKLVIGMNSITIKTCLVPVIHRDHHLNHESITTDWCHTQSYSHSFTLTLTQSYTRNQWLSVPAPLIDLVKGESVNDSNEWFRQCCQYCFFNLSDLFWVIHSLTHSQSQRVWVTNSLLVLTIRTLSDWHTHTVTPTLRHCQWV